MLVCHLSSSRAIVPELFANNNLFGPSGSGKTTLLGVLAGVLGGYTGQVEVLGRDIAKLSGSQRDAFRGSHFESSSFSGPLTDSRTWMRRAARSTLDHRRANVSPVRSPPRAPIALDQDAISGRRRCTWNAERA